MAAEREGLHAGSESGSALVMSLLIVIALSVVGATLTVLSLSETYGSMNYRLMSQARYGAESAVHMAANYFLNAYTLPGDPTDPINAYDLTASPVTAGGAPVVLSASDEVDANYPVPAVATAFDAAVAGSLVEGNANVQYSATATLLSMRQILIYGSATPATIQTWQITGQGATSGARNARVEVTATLERQTTSLFDYAVFATAAGCGALRFTGGSVVDSYDSDNIVMQDGSVVTQQSGGNIGSNGNLNEAGSGTTVYGTMSTPRTGVGNCSNGGVNAWTDSGHAQVTGGLVQLPQALTYPVPDAPNPLPPTTGLSLTSSSTCAGLAGCTAGCPSGLVLAPGSYGNISLTGQAVIHLTAGTYTINSLSMAGNAELIIDSGPVFMDLAGQGQSTVLDLTGGTLVNGALNPSFFQIQYAGTGTIKMAGGAAAAASTYAPNAAVALSGGSDWFGAIIARTVEVNGGTKIHNDRQLANDLFSVGNYMLSSFSWKKF
jgi:hypothetical protein